MAFELSSSHLSPAQRKILDVVEEMLELQPNAKSIDIFRAHYRELLKAIPQSYRQYHGADMAFKGVRLMEGYK